MTVAVRRYIRMTQVLRILLSGEEITLDFKRPAERMLLSKLLSRYKEQRLVKVDECISELRVSRPTPPSESPYVGRADRAPAPEQLWVRICISHSMFSSLYACVSKKRIKSP